MARIAFHNVLGEGEHGDLERVLLAFGAYFGSAIILTLLFVLIYVRTTPHNEIKLARATQLLRLA